MNYVFEKAMNFNELAKNHKDIDVFAFKIPSNSQSYFMISFLISSKVYGLFSRKIWNYLFSSSYTEN